MGAFAFNSIQMSSAESRITSGERRKFPMVKQILSFNKYQPGKSFYGFNLKILFKF